MKLILFIAEQPQILDDFPSLNRIQAQLIHVLDSFDVMEPSTAQCCQGSSNDDADNEDSIISSTSIFSSVFKVGNQIRGVLENLQQSYCKFKTNTSKR